MWSLITGTHKESMLHATFLNGRVSSNCTEIESEPHRLHKVVGARSTMDQHGKNAIVSLVPRPCAFVARRNWPSVMLCIVIFFSDANGC